VGIRFLQIALPVTACLFFTPTSRAEDALPSWNDGPTKRSIVSFVRKVTDQDSPDFVPPSERIAVFDNDGTLWSEQPMYVQAFFVFDRVKAMAADRPEWRTSEPYASVLEGDGQQALSGDREALVKLLMETHAGMTAKEFETIARRWIASARHPKTGKLFTEMVYQPMLEMLDYLRANHFKTFIVSGGGIEFIRPWSETVYGIPAEQVLGSRIESKFEIRDGVPVIVRVKKIEFINDHEGKPVGIRAHIGRRPIMAFGNSDGDFEMMQWTTAGDGPRMGVLVHHTDADREWAYDRESAVGRLARGLDEGPELGWTIVDMKKDWNTIHPDVTSQASGTVDEALIGSWLAEDIAGRGVVDRAQSTLTISPDGTVNGSTSVNRYSGKAETDNGQIRLGPLAMTRRAGPPALMDQEAKFTSALREATSYRIDEKGLLCLIGESGDVLLRFSKTKPSR